MPYIKKIKAINDLVLANLQKEYIFKEKMAVAPLLQEIWPLIFSYIPNDYFNLMITCQCFYKITMAPIAIKNLIALIPLDKKIYYLVMNNIMVPPMIKWEDIEEASKTDNNDTILTKKKINIIKRLWQTSQN